MNKSILGTIALGFFGLNYGMQGGYSDQSLLVQMRSLAPNPREHNVHVIAQRAAARCIVLFQAHARALPKKCTQLRDFCAACPAWLQPYVNAYAFMHLMAHKGGCRCQDLERLSKQADPEYLDEITGLPGTRDAVLKRATQDRNARLALYAVAMGADVYKVTCESACSMCSACRGAPGRFLIADSRVLNDLLSQVLPMVKQESV